MALEKPFVWPLDFADLQASGCNSLFQTASVKRQRRQLPMLQCFGCSSQEIGLIDGLRNHAKKCF